MTIHQMDILDRSGHTTVTWDPTVPAEVTAASTTFDAMVDEGYRAFCVEGDDRQGRRMDEFDPSAARIMFIPQLKGG